MDKTKSRVFVSYSQKDAPVVREIVHALKTLGLSVWSDESLVPGTDWTAELETALRQSDVYVFVISPDSLESPWVNFELGVALTRSADSPDVRIIPVMVENVDRKSLPPILRNLQIVKAEHQPPDRIASRLVEAIES